eukprot:XP_008650310.1 uncharacterized protein LOC103631085 [Zea mays]
MYIVAAAEAVSMVLVVERATPERQRPENSEPASGTQTVQKPVYYVSEVLHEAKATYLETHKLLYDVLVASRKSVGDYRYLFVAIDKFTKWPEATPVVNITQSAAVAFLKSIEYCEDIDIQLSFASMAHPRSNGHAERLNAEILKGLKTRTYNCLKKHGANWVSELPSVLWGNRTTPSRATGETPFFLVYRAEACLPPEIIMGSPRVQSFDESAQEQLRREDVEFIDEHRWQASIQNARYNQALPPAVRA